MFTEVEAFFFYIIEYFLNFVQNRGEKNAPFLKFYGEKKNPTSIDQIICLLQSIDFRTIEQ